MIDRKFWAQICEFLLQIRQALLMAVDAVERLLRQMGAFNGPRTSELRKESKSTRKE